MLILNTGDIFCLWSGSILMASVYWEKPEIENAMSKFFIVLAFVAIIVNSAHADTQVHIILLLLEETKGILNKDIATAKCPNPAGPTLYWIHFGFTDIRSVYSMLL